MYALSEQTSGNCANSLDLMPKTLALVGRNKGKCNGNRISHTYTVQMGIAIPRLGIRMLLIDIGFIVALANLGKDLF